jgi:hypothetical protein
MMSDAIHMVVAGAILLGHVALVVLSAYGVWYELTNWDGGVAFAYVLAGLLGVYGAWRSAEGLVDGTWKAVRVLAVTVPALVLLIVALRS